MSTRTPEEARAYRATHREQYCAYNRTYRAAHPERCSAYSRAHVAACPEIRHLSNARGRAKRAGIPCTLTLADVRDLLAPMQCSVTGLALVRGKGEPGPLSPSLDRIVPALGYVPGNVRLVCHRFNTLRKAADVSRDAEFRARVLAELGEVQA